ncbi:MAG TPA: sigma-70 family RNA polymerase sigma factor, partial [Vicinamibacterales bacterium]|nr:sigma-70 family RNA polymerase sigma factor [Vicinamibacterales bacterium]
AVQEGWIRLGRSDVRGVENLRAWLTTVVARVCLDMLRTRTSRREDSFDEQAEYAVHVPDPVITRADANPESDAMIADSVGLALLVVLETLEPAERLAFVLHDVFGMTFDEIGPIVDRTPVAARQLASRARRRVQNAPNADHDVREQRRVLDAFMAAVRDGDFERLMTILDPDIVLRADGGALARASRVVRGAHNVAAQAATFSKLGLSTQLVRVNGQLGFVSRRADGRLFSVAGIAIAGGKIVEIDILADPERLSRLDVSALDG